MTVEPSSNIGRCIWEVVGGAEGGGILVRTGCDLKAPMEHRRLSTGARVFGVQLVGDRLQFELLIGLGPRSGWVSVKAKGKDLLLLAHKCGGKVSCEGRVRVWALSDIHTDRKENWNWIQSLSKHDFLDDVLILAGDVANSFDRIDSTLCELRARFRRMFFCAGNHDLWVSKSTGEDSIARMQSLLSLCTKLNIETSPAEVASGSSGLLVVPFQSWHHPQWDVEPDLDDSWGNVSRVEEVVSDYAYTRWPPPICINDGSAARVMDSFNDELFDMSELIKQRQGYKAVLSFSHFVPRQELNPEKRYLIPPCLAKAVGSSYLQQRIDALNPDVHVFGHTHFGYDMVVEDVRYIQAPLGMPLERVFGGSLVSLGTFPVVLPEPCLVWDSQVDNGWHPQYHSAWSRYYARYGREPQITDIVPSVVIEHSRLEARTAACKAGFIAGRMPIWLFGPLEHRRMESKFDIERACSKHAESLQSSSTRRPSVVWPGSASNRQCCVFIDIRKDAVTPCDGRRICGAVPLPHPAQTEALPELPEKDLLLLCEQLNAFERGMVLYGQSSSEECLAPAFLLASYFRLWIEDVQVLEGGLDAWVENDGAITRLDDEAD